MFKHILFPYDGSEHSKMAINNVKSLAVKYGAKVTLMHALQFLKVSPIDKASYDYLNQLEHSLEVKSQQLLEEVAQVFQESDIVVEKIIESGKPRLIILDAIKKTNCDLVVMGSRGLGPVRSVLLGSVSHYILHHSSCPVYLMNQTESNFGHILFPIDGTELETGLVDQLIDVAKKYQSKVMVFHAWNTNQMHEYVDKNHPKFHSLYELIEIMKKEAHKVLFDVSRYIEKQGIEVSSEIFEGHIGEGILETAHNHDCDLIFMGKHKKQPIERWLLGSTSLFISNHSQWPVLFVTP